MLVPFLNADGAVGSPGISWVNESTSGIYRAGLNDQRWASSGVDKLQLTAHASNPLSVWNVGDASFRAVTDVFSPATIIGDWTWEGRLITDDSTTARAGFNIPLGVEPTVPVEGDMWKTAGDAFIYTGAAVHSIIGASQAPSTTQFAMLRANAVAGWEESTALLQEANVLYMEQQSLAEANIVDYGQLWTRDDGFNQSLMWTDETGNQFSICSINEADVNVASTLALQTTSFVQILNFQPKPDTTYVFQASFQAFSPAADDLRLELVIDTDALFVGMVIWSGGGGSGMEGLRSGIGEVITNIVDIATDGVGSPDATYITVFGTLSNGPNKVTQSVRMAKLADTGADALVYAGTGGAFRSLQNL
jgi:hypothetical protein